MEYQYQSKEELPPYLKAEQIAAYLGVSVGCVYTRLHTKGFPTIKLGRRMVVAREKLLKWLEENTAKL